MYFRNAVRKHGPKAFECVVLEVCPMAGAVPTREEHEVAGSAEQRWIVQLNCQVPFGFNIAAGGLTGPVHELTRRRLSENIRKGREAMGPDRRSEAKRKRDASLGHDRLSEIARKRAVTIGPERLSEIARATNFSLGPERLSEMRRKTKMTMGHERISEAYRKGRAAMSAEERSAIRYKGLKTMGPERVSEAAWKGKAGMGAERLSDVARKRAEALGPERRSEAIRRNAIGWAWTWIAIAFFGCGGSAFDVASQVNDAAPEASAVVAETAVATETAPIEAAAPDASDAGSSPVMSDEASAQPACPAGYVCALVDAGSDAIAPGDLPDPNCPAGVHTTVSGVVYGPTSQPEPNVVVYAPKSAAIPVFVCGDAGLPAFYGSAVTDATGHFVVSDVPPGYNVPIVVQSAQWRQLFRLEAVRKCVDNPQPDMTLYLADDGPGGASCYQASDN